jgi:quercetin dioxygenase-like cupin family protein
MEVVRFIATAEGESRFTTFDVPLEKKDLLGFTIRASNGFTSPNVSFVELPAGVDAGWHGATARRIGIVLSGVFEVEIGDGERRRWRVGELFLADDEAGRHATRVIEGPVRLVSIPFPAAFVIEKWSA